MLCLVCTSINIDALLSDGGLHHHASREAIVVSAHHGCDLCSLIITSQWRRYYENIWPPVDQENIIYSRTPTQIICKATKSPQDRQSIFSRIIFFQADICEGKLGCFGVELECATLEGSYNGLYAIELRNNVW